MSTLSLSKSSVTVLLVLAVGSRPVRESTVTETIPAGRLKRLSGRLALAACQRLWESIVREKLYVTGGIGGTSHGEAFSFPFDLPNDTIYSETCAAIGLAFFARRMLEIKVESHYADVCELALVLYRHKVPPS